MLVGTSNNKNIPYEKRKLKNVGNHPFPLFVCCHPHFLEQSIVSYAFLELFFCTGHFRK